MVTLTWDIGGLRRPSRSGFVAGEDVADRLHRADEAAGNLGIGGGEIGGAGFRRIERLGEARAIGAEAVQFALKSRYGLGVFQPAVDRAFEQLERRLQTPQSFVNG